MNQHFLPTFDAHTHFAITCSSEELAQAGPAFAMTLSLNEAGQAVVRQEPSISWGVGCHPRDRFAQETFEINQFSELAQQSAVIGEVGLDGQSRVPAELQLRNFRQILAYAEKNPAIVSVHSYRATRVVLDELRQRPQPGIILHWWTGTAVETQEAVRLGCYFSLHSAIANRSRFRLFVPPERILLESDQSWKDSPAQVPDRIARVEGMAGRTYGIAPIILRQFTWNNLAELVSMTGTLNRLPKNLRIIAQRYINNGNEVA